MDAHESQGAMSQVAKCLAGNDPQLFLKMSYALVSVSRMAVFPNYQLDVQLAVCGESSNDEK